MEVQSSPQQQSSPSSPLIVKQGDTVILVGNDNKWFIHQNIKPGTTVKLHKNIQVNTDSLIGQQYYAFYEVDKKEKCFKLMTSHPDPEPLYSQEESKEDLEKNNRCIIDNNRAQQLTAKDIDALKKDGTADDIINKLIENSASFAQKNNFSQQKYLKKKKQKYMTYVKVIPPTIHELARVYMEKKPDKISHLRFDSLAQLLYLGNVYSNTQVMVVETCMGLATAGVLERMSGYGRILKIAENTNQHMHCANSLNDVPTTSLVNKGEPMIVHIPFSLIGKMASSSEQQKSTSDSAATTTTTTTIATEASMETESTAATTSSETSVANDGSSSAVTSDSTTDDNTSDNAWKLEKQKQREEHEQYLMHLVRGKSDSLIIAGEGYDPESILVKLWPYLQSSGTFAIFCPYMQPLQNCYNLLRSNQHGMHALMLTLTETWTREQQVLPLRTHPVMRMHATSGFILAGIKVE